MSINCNPLSNLKVFSLKYLPHFLLCYFTLSNMPYLFFVVLRSHIEDRAVRLRAERGRGGGSNCVPRRRPLTFRERRHSPDGLWLRQRPPVLIRLYNLLKCESEFSIYRGQAFLGEQTPGAVLDVYLMVILGI